VDDHLLALDRRVQVRDDASGPAGRVGLAVAKPERQRFRRRSILAARAERAALELLGGRLGDQVRGCAGATRPAGRDDDEPTRERVSAKLSRD
jgi:hypothetical protein